MIDKRKLTMKAAVLLVALAASFLFSSAKSQAQNSTNSQLAFVDNFADPSTSSKQWDQTTNGGTLLFAKGSVFLKGVGGGCPVIKTHQNPFPVSSDWTASFGYRYTSIGNYGVDLSCVGPNGEKIADVHQDVNAQLVQVTDNLSWTKANIDWHVVCFVMTGSRIAVYLDGNLIGDRPVSVRPTSISIGGWLMTNSWDWNDLQVAFVSVSAGKHVLDNSALHLNETPVVVAAQPASLLSHDASVVNVQEDDKSLFCVLGDTIHLAGTTSGQHRLSRRTFLINSQPFSDAPANPEDNGYDFSWKPASPGNYPLDVKLILANPFRMVAAKSVDVTVLPKAPLTLEQFTKPVPASCPVAVQPVDTAIFQPARVEFFLNGQSVGSADKAPFQVTLPISKQTPGTYTVSYQAYDAQGARLNGESETVTVPVRVQLTMPTVVNLAAASDKTTFTSSIVPDLKIVRVDYLVDDQRVASTTVPPYDASTSLLAFKSGSHSVKSEVVIEDGETFCNPPTTLTLTNQPDDARQAQIAKDVADKTAALAKQVANEVTAKAEQERVNKEITANLDDFWPRPGFDEKIFRKQAAALAYYVPEQRHGQVGIVHGLSVQQEVTDDNEIVSETGVPLTVSASVRPGTGQTNFLAFSEEDSKITAQQAAEYCKTKTGAYHWDWSKYDLTVGYLENDSKHGGPSAGAADALAMMSAVLNVPVDSSVAITGAITLQGGIEPVGGILFKAHAAFDKSDVHNLLMPVDFIGSIDLFALYRAFPVLCFKRRVVFVRDMDDVMNQALIGWNTDSEVREEKLVQGGLRHFARGEDKQALAAFAAAKQITPENWTVDFWSAMVYAVEKQHNEDAITASGK